MYRQYVLVNGATRRVGWIDREPPLRAGQMVQLLGDDAWWVVEFAGRQVAMDAPPESAWQVGGIVGRMRLARRH